MFEDFSEAMKQQLEITYLGLLSYFLGIEVQQGDDGIFILQKKYATDILKQFKMDLSLTICTPIAERLDQILVMEWNLLVDL